MKDFARLAALYVIDAYEQRDCRLKKAFREVRQIYPELSDVDFQLAHEIAHGVVRYQLHLDWCLQALLRRSKKKIKASVRNILRIGIYQSRFLTRIPAYAAVHTCVELTRVIHQSSQAGFVNGLLRSYIRGSKNIQWPTERTKFLSVYYSYPETLVSRWLSCFGEEKTEWLLKRNNQRPLLGLRIDPLKTNRNEIVQKMLDLGITATICDKNDKIIHARSWLQLEKSQLYAEGFVQVQDESALLPVQALDVKPHLRVLDLCAAPGGKTTALAQCMHDQGIIIACDISRMRLSALGSNIKRLNLQSIRPVIGNGCCASQWLKAVFDRIIVDVPCTNTGVLSRRVEARWRFNEIFLQHLVQIQLQILSEALSLLKTGGFLVYSTCSIDSAENSELVEKVLNSFPNMRLLDQSFYFPDACQDGGYWAKIQRIT